MTSVNRNQSTGNSQQHYMRHNEINTLGPSIILKDNPSPTMITYKTQTTRSDPLTTSLHNQTNPTAQRPRKQTSQRSQWEQWSHSYYQHQYPIITGLKRLPSWSHHHCHYQYMITLTLTTSSPPHRPRSQDHDLYNHPSQALYNQPSQSPTTSHTSSQEDKNKPPKAITIPASIHHTTNKIIITQTNKTNHNVTPANNCYRS